MRLMCAACSSTDLFSPVPVETMVTLSPAALRTRCGSGGGVVVVMTMRHTSVRAEEGGEGEGVTLKRQTYLRQLHLLVVRELRGLR